MRRATVSHVSGKKFSVMIYEHLFTFITKCWLQLSYAKLQSLYMALHLMFFLWYSSLYSLMHGRGMLHALMRESKLLGKLRVGH